MPEGRAFFDTNVLVYAIAQPDPRQKIAIDLLMAGGVVGIQTLNEFANVLIGKLKMAWPETLAAVRFIGALCPLPVPVTSAVHLRGLRIARGTGYHLYDSLMLSAAVEASCTFFYSEDMHDGHAIEGLTIRNPFTACGPSRRPSVRRHPYTAPAAVLMEMR